MTAIGDVEVAPSDPEIVWIGTGEDFNARSSYYGNGIWKSTDAGETWDKYGAGRFPSYCRNYYSS